MKRQRILFTAFVAILPLLATSQTLTSSRTAALMTGDYATSGTVYLEAFDNGTLDLRFDDDYMTQSNVFDVHVFLSNDNNYTSPIDTAGMLLVENIGTINGLNYSSGAMTFNLPAGVGINDYQYIVLICVQFGQLHWADGTFGAEQSTASLSNLTNAPEFQLYPNPANENITLSGDLENKTIQILALDGSIVDEYVATGAIQTLNTQTLMSGNYIVKLTDPATKESAVIRMTKE